MGVSNFSEVTDSKQQQQTSKCLDRTQDFFLPATMEATRWKVLRMVGIQAKVTLPVKIRAKEQRVRSTGTKKWKTSSWMKLESFQNNLQDFDALNDLISEFSFHFIFNISV